MQFIMYTYFRSRSQYFTQHSFQLCYDSLLVSLLFCCCDKIPTKPTKGDLVHHDKVNEASGTLWSYDVHKAINACIIVISLLLLPVHIPESPCS